MPKICWYFQLHQPYRLAEFEVFDLGHDHSYFADEKKDLNREVFQKVAKKSYLPMLRLLKKLVKTIPDFTFTLSASGVFLEQAQAFEPEVIQLLKELAQTKKVEFLAETYYHSLAALYSPTEFKAQVAAHQEIIFQLFRQWPKVFRNTELIYTNVVAQQVADLGFQGMVTEAVERYLHGRPKTQVFYSTSKPSLPLLLKHAELSDDIAFRFSDKNWRWHPLTVPRYKEWLEVYDQDQMINLFMDFETFGEHQWRDTGIFDFFEHLIKDLSHQPWNQFVTPSQVLVPLFQQSKRAKAGAPDTVYDVVEPISWADVDRGITAWVENPLQQDSIAQIYSLEKKVLALRNDELLQHWRLLQTSDHFYYMCTKWSADGDVHAYFSPYRDPFEAYRRYSIILADLHERLLVTKK